MSAEADLSTVPILVWGLAGASLGMEVSKCLAKAGCTNLYGCDISSLAFGHYTGLFRRTFKVNPTRTRESLTEILDQVRPAIAIGGGDQVTRLQAANSDLLRDRGCRLCRNDPRVVAIASDKFKSIEALHKAGISVAQTAKVDPTLDIYKFPLPAILKPRIESGGSPGITYIAKREDLRERVSHPIQNNLDYVA
jgi:carbamoyl-phosphate synthase large subunit